METLASLFFPRFCCPFDNQEASPKLQLPIIRRMQDMHCGVCDTRGGAIEKDNAEESRIVAYKI